MKNFKVALIGMLLLSALSWWACNKENLTSGGKIVDVAFAGRIMDETGAAIAGAQVNVGGKMVLTDDNGVFRTEQVQLPDNDAILKVSKTGYFDFSRAYFVEDEALQTVTIQLLRRIQVGSFNNASGGTVNIPGGVSLKFPANTADASGTIRVYARYLNPTDEELGLFMPGDLRAIDAGGEEQTLGTFGMVAVELESSAGKTQIATGKEVELSMPIVNTQAADAPADIPLWYFDTEKARWIEEGTAQKVGNKYVGTVKHFSFWNCDVGLPLVQLSGKVYIGDLEHPLVGAQVQLTTTATNWPSYATTDANGCFSGGVIKDAEMVLPIQSFDQCGTLILYTQTIGPFSSNTMLQPIILSSSAFEFTTISGTLVDCSGQPVTNGYIRLSASEVAFADENGVFSYDLIDCGGVSSIIVQAFDLDNLKESPLQTVAIPANGGNVALGNITVCTGLDEYIQYTLDGQTFTASEPYGGLIDSMNTNQTIYLYREASGTTTIISLSFNASQPGTYPMTYFSVNNLGVSQAQMGNITTNLTTFAANVGDYFMGTFSGSFQDNQGVNHMISGSYRVKRDY